MGKYNTVNIGLTHYMQPLFNIIKKNIDNGALIKKQGCIIEYNSPNCDSENRWNNRNNNLSNEMDVAIRNHLDKVCSDESIDPAHIKNIKEWDSFSIIIIFQE